MAEPTPEQRALLEKMTESAFAALSKGVTREDATRELTGMGLSEFAAQRIVDAAAARLPAAAPPARQVWIARLPPGADPSEMVFAPSMGTRAEVEAEIRVALPEIVFDTEGRASLRRQGYRLDFDLGAEREVTLISVEVHGAGGALSAMKRISLRTGWRVLDRSADRLFDLPGGRIELLPPEPPPTARSQAVRPVLPTPTPAPAPTQSSPRFRRRARFLAAAAVVAVVGLVAAGATGDLLTERSIATNEEQAIADLREFATVELALAALNAGGMVAPDTLADTERIPALAIEGRPLAVVRRARFALVERDGYRFEFRPDGAQPVDAPIRPAWRSYVYVATPLEPGRTGRRAFAFVSGSGTLHVRYDGRVPSATDPVVR